MTIIAKKVIMFKCEKCNETIYHPNTLECGQYNNKTVKHDYIICSKCNYDNHVILVEND